LITKQRNNLQESLQVSLSKVRSIQGKLLPEQPSALWSLWTYATQPQPRRLLSAGRAECRPLVS